MLCRRVFLLCFDIAPTDRDRIQFVSADTPIQYFLASRLSVERPSFSLLDYGNRSWPVIVTDKKKCTPPELWIRRDGHFRSGLLRKFLRAVSVAFRFSGMHDVVAVGAQNFLKSNL